MKLNGSIISLKNQQTLYDFLIKQNYNVKTIAVERNGEIVPKADYNDVLLNDEDTLEVVQFVGGG